MSDSCDEIFDNESMDITMEDESWDHQNIVFGRIIEQYINIIRGSILVHEVIDHNRTVGHVLHYSDYFNLIGTTFPGDKL